MKTYKILVFKHLLKNNQIAKKGEEVKESQIINVAESLKGGFIEEVKSVKKSEPKAKEDKKTEKKSDKSK